MLSGYTVTTDGVDKNRNITLTNTHHPNNKKVWLLQAESWRARTRRRNDEAHRNALDDTTKTFAVQTWPSDGSQQSLHWKLGTYTLTETKAPAGYTKADDIVFRVDTGR